MKLENLYLRLGWQQCALDEDVSGYSQRRCIVSFSSPQFEAFKIWTSVDFVVNLLFHKVLFCQIKNLVARLGLEIMILAKKRSRVWHHHHRQPFNGWLFFDLFQLDAEPLKFSQLADCLESSINNVTYIQKMQIWLFLHKRTQSTISVFFEFFHQFFKTRWSKIFSRGTNDYCRFKRTCKDLTLISKSTDSSSNGTAVNILLTLGNQQQYSSTFRIFQLHQLTRL